MKIYMLDNGNKANLMDLEECIFRAVNSMKANL